MALLVTVEYAKTSHLNVPGTQISYFNLYIIYNLYFHAPLLYIQKNVVIILKFNLYYIFVWSV